MKNLVDLTGERVVLTDEGEAALALLDRDNPDPSRLLPAVVYGDWMDDGSAYGGYVPRDPETGAVRFWNGWAMPLLPIEAVRDFVVDQLTLVAGVGAETVSAVDFHDETGKLTVIWPAESGAEPETQVIEPEVFERDPDHGEVGWPTNLWDLGNLGWTFALPDGVLDRDPFHAWLAQVNAHRAEHGRRKINPTKDGTAKWAFGDGRSAEDAAVHLCERATFEYVWAEAAPGFEPSDDPRPARGPRLVWKDEDEVDGRAIGPLFFNNEPLGEWVSLALARRLAEKLGVDLQTV